MGLIAELKRRNVVRVGIAYVVIAWLLAQVAEFAFENFGAPDWVLKSFVVILLLGLPLALLFAWAFEMTPEGLKREKDVDREASITPQTGRKIDRVIIVALALALAYFIWDGIDVDTMEENSAVASGQSEAPVTVDRSIAVLPFVNMSSDEEQEWFADGLTEELLNSLARMPDLLVAARTSSFGYKGSTENIPAIAKALGVAHVLEGSVRRGKDRLRVTAQLIRASDGFHLWSETYDRSPDDVIAIQEDLAIEIAGALEIALDPEALATMVSAGTASVPAYEAYLEGLALNAQSNQSGNQSLKLRAREAYEKALAIDPEFFSAHVEMSFFWASEMTFNNIGSQLLDIPPAEKLRHFKEHIGKAIVTTTDEVGVDVLRAREATVDLRFNDAFELLTRYVAARPNDAEASQDLVNILMRQGRWTEAVEHMGRSAELNADDPIPLNWLIAVHVFAGEYAGAADLARKTMRRFPGNAVVLYQAHRAFIWNGEYDEARTLIPMIEASELPPVNLLYVGLRQACADGDVDAARRVMDTIETDFGGDVMWIPYHLTGQLDKIEDLLMPIHDSGQLFALSEFLNYPYFDPNPYPQLMKVLEREDIARPDPIEIPFACQF
jgi:TolB-like protein/Tfp pilus assembly protein PilF